MTPDEIIQSAEQMLKDCRSMGTAGIGCPMCAIVEFFLAERKAMKETLAEHVHCQECNAIVSLRGMFVGLKTDNSPPHFCTFECAEKHLEKHPELQQNPT